MEHLIGLHDAPWPSVSWYYEHAPPNEQTDLRLVFHMEINMIVESCMKGKPIVEQKDHPKQNAFAYVFYSVDRCMRMLSKRLSLHVLFKATCACCYLLEPFM